MLFALNMTLVSDFFIGPLQITYVIGLSIAYPSTLNKLYIISNSTSCSVNISTNTLTSSSRLLTFTTSSISATSTSMNVHSIEIVPMADPTLFPNFTSLKSKMQSCKLRNDEIKD
eukprot:Awhi_evm1s10962